jgi:hypothetical protein
LGRNRRLVGVSAIREQPHDEKPKEHHERNRLNPPFGNQQILFGRFIHSFFSRGGVGFFTLSGWNCQNLPKRDLNGGQIASDEFDFEPLAFDGSCVIVKVDSRSQFKMLRARFP